VLLQRLESWVTFVALRTLDVVVGPNSWGTGGRSHSDISARPWGYGFTHAGSWQRYCGQNNSVSSMIIMQTAEVGYMIKGKSNNFGVNKKYSSRLRYFFYLEDGSDTLTRKVCLY
jgi:hypothetical protein